MHDYNLFADIKKLLIESHTKEEIKNLSTSELKKLHKEYSEKDTDEAKSEAEMIEKEIESRGEDNDSETKSETKLDEEDNRASPIFNTHKPVQDWNRVADYYSILAKKEAARRAEVDKEMAERKAKAEAAKKKPDVAQQNEELLAILDTLCEMVGVDMETLMEQMTRKDFVNWGQAEGWNEPAPAAAPHGSLAANARDILVKAARARGTRSQRLAAAARAGAIKTGKDTAYDIETSAPIQDVHEPTARERAAGAPGAVVDPTKFDRSQRSIEKITDDVARVEKHRELINRLEPFTLGGNKPKVNKPKVNKPKGKGKGKK